MTSVDLRDEVLAGEAEQVDRRLARVEAGAGVGDHLDELGDRRDVELLHLAREHVGDERRDAGESAGPRREVQARVADGRDLDVLVLGLVDRVQAEEREEHVRLDALHARAVGHDQPRVDALERALRDDDRDLLDRRALRASSCASTAAVIPSVLSRCSRAAWGCRRSWRRASPGPSGRARRAP